MRFAALNDWLAWQETLHPQTIDMGLQRVAQVVHALALKRPAPLVISVAGTNGKGSCVALLESIFSAAGYKVGAYTSPHLLRYNERVRIAARAMDDTALCAAFERIDQARGDTSLTYFEFGTLAALDIFAAADLDIAILEVGLGGRLDAVNIIDADVALITSIGIDHVEWLGTDREAIGAEKAGIFRAGRAAVYGEADAPQSVQRHAEQTGASLLCLDRDYRYAVTAHGWDWWSAGVRYAALPLPNLPGTFQLQNAAAVLMVLLQVAATRPVSEAALHCGLTTAHLPGRFQILPGAVEWIVDVAHNPHGATALAKALEQRPCAGQTHLVLAMLADKDAQGVVGALRTQVDYWYCAGLSGARSQSGATLAARAGLGGAGAASGISVDVAGACAQANATARAGDRIVVCGSFHTVAEALQCRSEFA